MMSCVHLILHSSFGLSSRCMNERNALGRNDRTANGETGNESSIPVKEEAPMPPP